MFSCRLVTSSIDRSINRFALRYSCSLSCTYCLFFKIQFLRIPLSSASSSTLYRSSCANRFLHTSSYAWINLGASLRKIMKSSYRVGTTCITAVCLCVFCIATTYPGGGGNGVLGGSSPISLGPMSPSSARISRIFLAIFSIFLMIRALSSTSSTESLWAFR